MFLYRHDLDGVVPQLADTGKHVAAELKVRVNLGLLTGHAHVALVDLKGAGPARDKQGCGLNGK